MQALRMQFDEYTTPETQQKNARNSKQIPNTKSQ